MGIARFFQGGGVEELKALPNGYVQGLLGWYLHFLALMSLRASEEINYCPKEVQYCARCTEQGSDGGGRWGGGGQQYLGNRCGAFQ